MAGELGQVWPETVQMVLQHLVGNAKNHGRQWFHFRVNMLPKSLNKMYLKGRSFKNKQGQQKTTFRLHPDIETFRVEVCQAMGIKRWQWKPTGVTAAVILLESQFWLTQKREIREKDADNLVKPILDAVQNATEVPDELHWQLHVFKLPSKWNRTTVYLFDLGDLVEFYY